MMPFLKKFLSEVRWTYVIACVETGNDCCI
jgi:hypothetical protein